MLEIAKNPKTYRREERKTKEFLKMQKLREVTFCIAKFSSESNGS
jgi:hypothetical protein